MNVNTESSSSLSERPDPSPERRGMRRIVNPFRCRVWTQHSRPEEQLSDDACMTLRESLAKSGQHQPVLGRPVRDDPDYDIEIICGARRHAAARSLGRNLLVEVREITDAEAYVAMYDENFHREGDSPYVHGQILLRALRSHTYSSQEELALAFNLSHSKVSRLLMVAQLPSIVVAAFLSPRDIRECWGVELYKLWKATTEEGLITDRARALAGSQPRPPARQVYEILLAQPGNSNEKPQRSRNVPVRGSNGVILFREQDREGHVMFTVPKARLTPQRREALKQAMMTTLDVWHLDPSQCHDAPIIGVNMEHLSS